MFRLLQCPRCLHLQHPMSWPEEILDTKINIKINTLVWFFFLWNESHAGFLKEISTFLFWKAFIERLFFSSHTVSQISSCHYRYLTQLFFIRVFNPVVLLPLYHFLQHKTFRLILPSYHRNIVKELCSGVVLDFIPLWSRICPFNAEENMLPTIIKIGQRKVNWV